MKHIPILNLILYLIVSIHLNIIILSDDKNDQRFFGSDVLSYLDLILFEEYYSIIIQYMYIKVNIRVFVVLSLRELDKIIPKSFFCRKFILTPPIS